jgi:hypothetical protein
VYRTTDHGRHQRTLALLTAAGTATMALVALGVPPMGGAVLGPACAWVAWRWRRPVESRGVVLRITRGVLHIRRPDRLIFSASLFDIANVTLDSRTIRKVEEGNTLVPGMRFLESRLGPELEVVRIVIEVSGVDEPTRLSEAFVPHMDGVEWLGRIRRFLRAHGWVPEDERETEPAP